MTTHPITEARLRSRSPFPTSEPGWCLREVRECFGVHQLAPTAAAAWGMSKHQHKTADANRIPRRVPVFWTGGSDGAGHIAIGLGDGMCWSTDIRRPGWFDRVPILEVARKWPQLKLVGWTEDLNGVTVWGPA